MKIKIVGIYKITNLITGQIYIGLSVDCQSRIYVHKHKLKNNNHKNQHLQNSWNKYGEINFSFEIIEESLPEDLPELEKKTIEKYESYDKTKGFNKSFGGEHNLPTEETRIKLSKACKKRKPVSEETRRKISIANKGKKRTEEEKAYLSKVLKGRPSNLSEEQKKHKSEKLKGNKYGLGHKLSEESKAKISLANKGNTYSAGRKMTPEHYEAFIGANKGKPRSEETRAKISATRKLRNVKKLPEVSDNPEGPEHPSGDNA